MVVSGVRAGQCRVYDYAEARAWKFRISA